MRYTEWQAKPTSAQLLETFPPCSDCKVILYAGVTRAMRVPGRVGNQRKDLCPEELPYAISNKRESIRPTTIASPHEFRERERGVLFFRLYQHRVDVSRMRYIGCVLTMHFHNVLGKFAHAERGGIDTEGSYERHAIHCVYANNVFKYRKNGNSYE